MRNFAQVTLLGAFLVMANAPSGFAQQGSHFQRVTTTASSSGTRSAAARTLRSAPARDVQAPRSANGTRLASVSTTRAEQVARLRAQTDVLHPYSSRSESLAQSDDRGSNGGRFSTWRNEPQPAAPAPRVAAAPRSHNYYPTLRSGVYACAAGPAHGQPGFSLSPVVLHSQPFPGDGRHGSPPPLSSGRFGRPRHDPCTVCPPGLIMIRF